MANPDFVNDCPVCLGKLGEEDVARQLPCNHGLHAKCLEKLMSHQGYQASAATSDNSSSSDSDSDSTDGRDEPQMAAEQYPDFPPDPARMQVDQVVEVKYYDRLTM